MFNRKTLAAMLIGLSATVPSISLADAPPSSDHSHSMLEKAGKSLDETAMTTHIKGVLFVQSGLKHVSVTTSKGVVTLGGKVETQAKKDEAFNKVKEIVKKDEAEGKIKLVRNNIKVEPPKKSHHYKKAPPKSDAHTQ